MLKMIPISYRVLFCVLLLLFAIWLVFAWGKASGLDQCHASQLKALQQRQVVQQKKASAAQAVAIESAVAMDGQRVIYKTITKEVVRYAKAHPVSSSPRADAACGVDVGGADELDSDWVRIHDAAAQPSAAASALASEPGAVAKADTLMVVVGNYERCNAWREQLIGWQRWWQSQEGADDSP